MIDIVNEHKLDFSFKNEKGNKDMTLIDIRGVIKLTRRSKSKIAD